MSAADYTVVCRVAPTPTSGYTEWYPEVVLGGVKYRGPIAGNFTEADRMSERALDALEAVKLRAVETEIVRIDGEAVALRERVQRLKLENSVLFFVALGLLILAFASEWVK